jgi:hypothetical protein
MSRRKRFTRNLGRKLRSPLPVRTTVEWVRFEHESEPFGVFSYLSEACDLLSEEGRKELQAIRDWFNERLDAPDLLTIKRFWFCAEAQEYVVRARRLAEVLCSIGIPIVERRTRRVPAKSNGKTNIKLRSSPTGTRWSGTGDESGATGSARVPLLACPAVQYAWGRSDFR